MDIWAFNVLRLTDRVGSLNQLKRLSGGIPKTVHLGIPYSKGRRNRPFRSLSPGLQTRGREKESPGLPEQ